MSEWVELRVTGPYDALEALLAAAPSYPLTDRSLDLAEETLSERLLEAIHLDFHHRVFLPVTDAEAFVESLRAQPALRLVGRRARLRGRFAFRAETPSHQAAAAIHGALAGPAPEGTVLHLLQEQRSQDPTAHGVHLYDRAAHEFVYTVRGEAEGAIPGIFELHRRLGGMEFMDVERLKIEGDADSQADPKEVG